MKKLFGTALTVALLGAMSLGAVASSASGSHKPTKNICLLYTSDAADE